MKKAMTGCVVAVMVICLSAGLALAGYGQGGSRNGPGGGDGPIHNIFDGEPFTYSGDVIEFATGQGLVLATGEENVTIYGIGPVRYWESLGIARPVVGDTLTVDGYAVDYNGEIRNIAVTVTIGDSIVDLRDPETGLPLWRGSGR